MSFAIYTIASENPFLRVLAKWLLNSVAKQAPLSRATVLVPNRRSARALESVLLEESGKPAMLLPTIKPIGDIDEDLIADSLSQDGVADAISKSSHLHAILHLLVQWAKSNPQLEFARDVLASGAQAFALAQSLQQLVNQFETEDVVIDRLQGVYDLDLAGHRQNILDLLKVITAELPKLLEAEKVIGPSARRNAMIRLEADRISQGKHRGPIIAAGSTGTNPATRDLLKAIARDPLGTVVLPGLDLALDDIAWSAITSEHPQFSLKTMLEQWGVTRTDVRVLGKSQSSRMWLLGQALRPAAVAEQWSESLRGQKAVVLSSLEGVELVETADRQQEADVIALALRRHVETSSAKAAVMTPDRDLATRVKSALQRWNLDIDDSAGEPLLHTGRAAMLLLLLQTIEERFSAASLFALLYHVDCTFGQDRQTHLECVRALELIAYRGMPEADGLLYLAQRIEVQKAELTKNNHAHPLLKKLSASEWDVAYQFAIQLNVILAPLGDGRERTLRDHVENLTTSLEVLSPLGEVITPADQSFLDIMTVLKDGTKWHPLSALSKTQHSILHALSQETLRPPFNPESQLAIYGLAEARLVDVELLILGGLTEGAWPARPDSGPWLNRPMREALKLQQPERDIGVTAHDFVQGFGHPKVMVTWPTRLKGAPAIPSRWVLRLQAVMTAAAVDAKHKISNTLPLIASRLDVTGKFAPLKQPRPTPPMAARPTTYSVTRIEKLIRDSYHVYAQQIIKLIPLDSIGQDVDARLHGSLIHTALQEWTAALKHVPESEHLHLLLLKGREAFAPFMEFPEVNRFWWPRFERMAAEFIMVDAELRGNIIGTLTEISGHYNFSIENVNYLLTARADRIDILQNGGLRIIDYKSGKVPSGKQMASGFAPQLTLEALIATQGSFKQVHSKHVDDVLYCAVGGGNQEVKFTGLAKGNSISEEIAKTKLGLMSLLLGFQNPQTAFLPRINMEKDSDVSDYDHLSRKLEWQLEGTTF